MAITWQNIAGPNFGDAMRGMSTAQSTINSAFGQADKLLGNHIDNRDNAQQQAYLDLVAAARTPEELAALQASGQLDQMRQGMSAASLAKVRGSDETRLRTLYDTQEQGLKREDSARARELDLFKYNRAIVTENERPMIAQINSKAVGGDFKGAFAEIDAREQSGQLSAESAATARASVQQQQDKQAERNFITTTRATQLARDARIEDVDKAAHAGKVVAAQSGSDAELEKFKDFKAGQAADVKLRQLKADWEKDNPEPPIMASSEIHKAYQEKRRQAMRSWPDAVSQAFTDAGGKDKDTYLRSRSDQLATMTPVVGIEALEAQQRAVHDQVVLENGGPELVRQKNINEALLAKVPNTAIAYEPLRAAVQDWTSKTIKVDVGGSKVEIPMPEEFIKRAIDAVKVDNSSWIERTNNTGDNFDAVMEKMINDPGLLKAIADKYKAQAGRAGVASKGTTDAATLNSALYGTPNPGGRSKVAEEAAVGNFKTLSQMAQEKAKEDRKNGIPFVPFF